MGFRGRIDPGFGRLRAKKPRSGGAGAGEAMGKLSTSTRDTRDMQRNGYIKDAGLP